MSADKHKRRDRAYAFIRSLADNGPWFPRRLDHKKSFSGPPSHLMRYCVEKGMAVIRRTRPGEWYAGRNWNPARRPRHNIFDADT